MNDRVHLVHKALIHFRPQPKVGARQFSCVDLDTPIVDVDTPLRQAIFDPPLGDLIIVCSDEANDLLHDLKRESTELRKEVRAEGAGDAGEELRKVYLLSGRGLVGRRLTTVFPRVRDVDA